MFKTLIPLIFGLGLLLLAVRRLRQYRLKERYTLLFFFIALPMFLLAMYPWAVGWIARGLDIEYRTVALLGVTGLFAVLILELLSIVSVQDRKINTLAQIVGILMERHHGKGAGDLPTEEELRALVEGTRQPVRPWGKRKAPVMLNVSDEARREANQPPAGGASR